jgi:hypothetical protein
MTPAMRNRQEAIGMLSELYLPESQQWELTNRHGGGLDSLAVGMSRNIEKLSQLGRTARWKAAINRWATMVAESGNSDRALRHAFIQGMIYAGHASE